MSWFKVDSRYLTHPAVAQAGDAAMGLWLRMGCWLATFPDHGDFIPTSCAKFLGRRGQIRSLVEAELLLEVDGGYLLNRSMAICHSRLPGNSWAVEQTVTRRFIPGALRTAVYDRDGNACLHCGSTEELSLDHVHPFSLGGSDTLDNLQTLCRSCNSKKGARV